MKRRIGRTNDEAPFRENDIIEFAGDMYVVAKNFGRSGSVREFGGQPLGSEISFQWRFQKEDCIKVGEFYEPNISATAVFYSEADTRTNGGEPMFWAGDTRTLAQAKWVPLSEATLVDPMDEYTVMEGVVQIEYKKAVAMVMEYEAQKHLAVTAQGPSV